MIKFDTESRETVITQDLILPTKKLTIRDMNSGQLVIFGPESFPPYKCKKGAES